MSVSSSIDFRLSTKPETVEALLTALKTLGWSFHSEGYAEFLPQNDDGDFAWQREKVDEDKLFYLLAKKWIEGEAVGLVIRYKKGDTGGELLIKQEGVISLSTSINRRTISEKITLTDVSWYLERLTPAFGKTVTGASIESIFWSEHA